MLNFLKAEYKDKKYKLYATKTAIKLTSPSLYYQINKNKSLTNQVLGVLLSWLMRTGSGQDFYFRPSKNSYQQGEQISIFGKPNIDSKFGDEGLIHVYSNDSLINTKPLFFNSHKANYEGKFWASKPGKLDYEIEIFDQENSRIVSRGEIQVQESQIELNKVFLNELPLKKIAKSTNGTFNYWDNRFSLPNIINQETEKNIVNSKIILKDNKLVFILIVLLLSIEWLKRRRLGFL